MTTGKGMGRPMWRTDRYKVGDTVTFSPGMRHEGKTGVVVKTQEVPERSRQGVGHTQWVEIKNIGLFSGWWFEPLSPTQERAKP